jgi:transposase InsO family protein
MKSEHSISQLCAAFGVKRSGYHAWLKAAESRRELDDQALRRAICQVHQTHRGRYGAPRIQKELSAQGQRHGCKRVARLMRMEGLRGLCPRRFVPRTTQSNHDQPIAANRLAQEPAPTGPNQTWVTDLTYVSTQEGWLYRANASKSGW